MMNDTIILASQSVSRQKMLQFAGVKFSMIPANINETNIIQTHDGGTETLVQYLASEKASLISHQQPDAYIIGGDSVLLFNGEVIEKSKNMDDACILLKKLRGKQQILYSAVSVYHQKQEVFCHCDKALLEMFDFSDEFLDNYLSEMGDAILQSVGCAMIEMEGIRLFHDIKGDYWTIMGLPLLPLLDFLRTRNLIEK